MKKGLLHLRIPTLFAFLILAGSLWITLFSLKNRVITTGRASPDTIPQNITIANITDESFSVSFITPQATEGVLSVTQPDGVTNLVIDDRDKDSGKSHAYSTHLITVNRLKPSTTYSFSILSNGKEYINNGAPFTVTTGPKISESPPTQNPLFGKILLPDGSPANDTLVTLTAQNSQVLAVLTNDKGEYLIPTNSLKRAGLDGYFILSPQTELTITGYWKNLISNLKILYQNSSSIPTITISNEYDFIQNYQLTQKNPTGELTLPSALNLTQEASVSIITPKQDEYFVDKRPQLKGTAIAENPVTIILDGKSYSIEANTDGIWTFRTSFILSQGNHTVTVESRDHDSKNVRISRSFSIFPEGSQIVESATPSATPKITPTPTKTPTPTRPATPSPTVLPTDEPTPTLAITTTPLPTVSTPTPTLLPTVQPTATATATLAPTTSATTSPPPPQKLPAGSNTTLIGLIISGLIIGAGTLVFLLL